MVLIALMQTVRRVIHGRNFEIVATHWQPDDMPPRTLTLARADFIAAEDTRATMKLLNHSGKSPYRSANTQMQAEPPRIEAGELCAVV